MTTKEAVAVFTQEEVVDKLLAAGWTRMECPDCKGVGSTPLDTTRHFVGMARANYGRVCDSCAGEGKRWKRPAEQIR